MNIPNHIHDGEKWVEQPIVSEDSGLDKPKQHFHAPTVLALAVTIILIFSIFSLGFWAGVQTLQNEQPTKQAGPVFERSLARQAQPLLVKMPEELP